MKPKNSQTFMRILVLTRILSRKYDSFETFFMKGYQKEISHGMSQVDSLIVFIDIRFHPDKQSHLAPAELEKVTLEFATILKFYKVLLDETTRKNYDITGRIDIEDESHSSDW